MTADGAAGRAAARRRRRARWSASSCPTAWSSLKGAAGPAPRPPRPGGRRALAAARRDAQARVLAGARAAQRAARAHPLGPRLGRDARRRWDRELAVKALALRAAPRRGRGAAQPSRSPRRAAAARLQRRARCSSTGPARGPSDEQEFVAELRERLHGDLERGFTGHGPHRDELAIAARRARAARLRLAGRAAPRPARAAARRARRARRRASPRRR